MHLSSAAGAGPPAVHALRQGLGRIRMLTLAGASYSRNLHLVSSIMVQAACCLPYSKQG